MNAVAAAGEPRATRRDWAGLVVLALPCLLYAMDLTVLNLAVPRLSADLRPSSAQLLWIVDIYGFTLAGSLIIMGALGDRIGRRRLLLAGAAGFGAASVFAAFSASAAMLIVARAVLGVAGATLAPSTLSLIRVMFLDPGQRRLAVAVWITSFSAGGAIGPVLGGVLLSWFWWGSVFLLAVPVMGLLLVLGPLVLPEYRDQRAGRLDLLSGGLSLAAVLALIYGIKQLALAGVAWLPVLSILAGVALGAAFVRRQRRLPDPLLDLRLFRVPAFSAALGTYAAGIFVVFGTLLFTAQYLQLVLGMSPLRAGLWSLPSGAGFIAGSTLAPLLTRRFRPAQVVAAGLTLAAVGFGLLTQTGAASGLEVLVTGALLYSAGVAPALALSTDLIIAAAPPERAGAAAAIAETGSELGGALGIALLGVIGNTIYRGQVAGTLPGGISALASGAARQTLAGAVTSAGRLPGQLRAGLLDAARQAFTHGLHAIAGISATIVVGVAIMDAVLLSRTGTGTGPGGDGSYQRPGGPAQAKEG
jgi:DHA2 family multidrug resistance protein-like MFS transporter